MPSAPPQPSLDSVKETSETLKTRPSTGSGNVEGKERSESLFFRTQLSF